MRRFCDGSILCCSQLECYGLSISISFARSQLFQSVAIKCIPFNWICEYRYKSGLVLYVCVHAAMHTRYRPRSHIAFLANLSARNKINKYPRLMEILLFSDDANDDDDACYNHFVSGVHIVSALAVSCLLCKKRTRSIHCACTPFNIDFLFVSLLIFVSFFLHWYPGMFAIPV